MSLRDQLLAKGLATKKQARRIDQEERAERKSSQGARKSKRELEAEARASEAELRRRELQARKQRRADYESQRAEMERALQVRNTILGNRIRSRGAIPFHHRSLEGAMLHRMFVGVGMAQQLRAGEAAIVAHQGGHGLEYVVLTRQGAHKLEQLAPRLVVFWVREPLGAPGPELGFLDRDWDASLGARRASPEDLARFSRLDGRGPSP